jgi:hypothetical protein
MKNTFIFFILFLIVFKTEAQNIRYVKPISTGIGDGSSWANASHDLQAMMNSLKSTGGQVWVAQGTYKPLHKVAGTTYAGYTTTDRHKSFVLVKDVEIYGGFRGLPTDTALHCRNWDYYETILSGDLGIQGDSMDNSYHVVISADDVGNACLDGFTITDAYLNDDSDSPYNIYINNYLVFRSCGGGIYITNSSPLIKNIVIEKNIAVSLKKGHSVAFFIDSISLLTD